MDKKIANETENISCIIAAYNEGPRIGGVLSVITNHPLVKEVIVINDCSTDNTRQVVEKFKKVQLINNEINKGKSFSVFQGLRASKYNIIMLIDADLLGLTKENLTALIEPVLDGKADMSISMRNNSYYKLFGLDFVSGERVFRKNLIKDYGELANIKGYLIETFINKKAVENNWKIKSVKWKNVANPMIKSEKMGFLRGMIRQIKMTISIINYLGLYKNLYIMAKMLHLAGKD